MSKTVTLGVRAHDVGLESLPACFTAEAIETLASRVASKRFAAVQFTMADAFPAVKSAQLNQGMASTLRRSFASRNIQIAILSCYINPIHPDPEERKKELTDFYRYLEFCRDLGCNYVATETGSVNADLSFHQDNHGPKAMEELLESLRQMLSWARDFGAGVAIEGVSKFVAHSPVVIKKILDLLNSANLRVILDPVNLLAPRGGTDIRQEYIDIVKESFALYGDDIVAIHLKDFRFDNGKLINVPIGTGLAPFDFLLNLAAERKPGLPLIMEEQNVSTMEDSIKHINHIDSLPPYR